MSIHAQTNDITHTKEHHAGWSTVVSFTKKIGSLIVDAWMNTIVFSYSLVYQLTNLLPWERAIRVEAKATRSRHSAMDQYRMSIFLSFLLTTASGSRRNTTTSTNTSCRENGLIDCRLQSKHFGERTVAVNTVFSSSSWYLACLHNDDIVWKSHWYHVPWLEILPIVAGGYVSNSSIRPFQ